MNAQPYHKKLARVLDTMGGLYLVDDLLTAIAKNEMQSFSIGNSWAVTQVSQFPRAKRLQIVAAVGDMADMVVLHDRILEYADGVNASLVSTLGRRGWLPQAREHGWRLKAKNYLYQKDC